VEFPYTIGLGFEFSSGAYGTNTRTDTIYAPLTIAVSPTDRLNLSLGIPFVNQSNGNVVSGIGVENEQTSSSTVGITTSPAGKDQSQSGIGDISLRIGYSMIAEKDSIPQIRPSIFVKFPTADKNKSLGTGEFDEGFAVEISKWFGDWYTFGEAGYTVQGKSAQYALRNYLTYNTGVGYRISEKIFPSLLINGTSPSANGVSSLVEVQLKLQYQVMKHTGLIVHADKGITSFSPDYRTGLMVYYNF
jgi:hypothetical protein